MRPDGGSDYPNGFKTSMVLTSTEVDYYSIIKDMWANVGIDLAFDLKESRVKSRINNEKSYPELMAGTTGPVSVFYGGTSVHGVGPDNRSNIDDPVIDAALVKLQRAAITDMKEAMRIYKQEIFKYALDQVYAIPNVTGPTYYLWWPWLKNYSGEGNVGFGNISWSKWIWYDQDMKKSMGY